MDPVNDTKTEEEEKPMLDQMSEGCSVANYIDQIAARAVYRQERKKCKQGYNTPDCLIAFYVFIEPPQFL